MEKEHPAALPRKTALVTGSTSGLGAAIATELRKRNFRVIGLGRSRPADTPETEFITLDLSQPGAAQTAASELRKRTGRLDLLVNNAGFGGYAAWEELPEADLRRMFEVDFFAPVLLTCELLPMLEAAQGGIIDLASVAALAPVPCMGAYSAVKGAFHHFSQTLRAELKRRRIRVLTVCPGRIATGFSSRAVRIRECPETPGGKVDTAKFARKVVNCFERDRARLIYPRWYGFFLAFTRTFPELYGKLACKLWKLK